MNYVIRDGSTKDILVGDKLICMPGVLPPVLEPQDLASVVSVARQDILVISINGLSSTIDISPDIILSVWRQI